MVGKKTGKFDGKGIEGLAKDKPVVYKIEDSRGKNLYTGIAKRGASSSASKSTCPRGPIQYAEVRR